VCSARVAQEIRDGGWSCNAEIMFIGEGPGFHENEQGRPFVGASGKFLDQLLEQADVTRADVFIANVVKCRPPANRDPQPDELASLRCVSGRADQGNKSEYYCDVGSHFNEQVIAWREDQCIHGQMQNSG
jgi:uracil-DNA glycosylase family 4